MVEKKNPNIVLRLQENGFVSQKRVKVDIFANVLPPGKTLSQVLTIKTHIEGNCSSPSLRS